jgi:DNA-directed RNA polymerase subunit K/omega
VLTRFERARIIGARALQISMGAPVLTKTTKTMSNIDIARQEFDEAVLPIAVIRRLPEGQEIVLNIKGEVIGKTSQ